MKRNIALSLALNLIALTSLVRADFLDYAGNILWHSNDNDCESFFGMYEEPYSRDINEKLNLPTSYPPYDEYQGWTMLMMAAHTGNYKIAEFLLERGASCLIKNNTGETAISIAKRAGHEHIVELIAKYAQPKSLVDQAARILTSKEGIIAFLKFIPKKEFYDFVTSQVSLMYTFQGHTPSDLHEKIEYNLEKK